MKTKRMYAKGNARILIKPGERYGFLEVRRMVPPKKGKRPKAVCLCHRCGKVAFVQPKKLLSGHKKSCGCLRFKKEGRSRTSEYGSWAGMLLRCTGKGPGGKISKRKDFENYMDRGIGICERWLDFDNFMEDMGPKPSDKHTIERRDNDGNYEPGNCRWATRKEQNNNTRKNVFFTYKGRRQTMAQWAEETGIPYGRLQWRLLTAKWSIEDALTTKGTAYCGHGKTMNQRREMKQNPGP